MLSHPEAINTDDTLIRDLKHPHTVLCLDVLMSLRLTPGTLIVERIPSEYCGGIVTAYSRSTDRKSPCLARVLMVGPFPIDPSTGRPIRHPVQAGDRVYIPRYAGWDIRVTGVPSGQPDTPDAWRIRAPGYRDAVCIDISEVLLHSESDADIRRAWAAAFKI
jgi:co-chaperonin GroES (HSP10)